MIYKRIQNHTKQISEDFALFFFFAIFSSPELHSRFTATSLASSRHEVQYLLFKSTEGILHHKKKQTLYLENKCDAEQTVCFSLTVVCRHCREAEKTTGNCTAF